MLHLPGIGIRHCDGISRREFLSIGALGVAGLSLADLLKAEAAAGLSGSHRAVINIHLDGGPPQHETIDPKPLAPSEIRGEFGPIATKVPGLHVGELMPRLAQATDRFAFIRTLVGSAGRHDAFQCQSGYSAKDLQSLGGRPAMGSVVSRLYGSPEDVAPAFVDLMQGRPLVRNSARPGFLGPAHTPFRPDLSQLFPRELEPGMKGELSRLGDNHSLSLTLDESLTVGRLRDRHSLQAALDQVRREIDSSGMMAAMDQFQQQAVGILTSGRLAEALDLSREDPAVLERFIGPGNPDVPLEHYTSEGPRATQKFLLARRLIEAGVRFVSVSISDFDTHSNNSGRMRQLLPIVDHGLVTLVDDLAERGLLEDVAIVVWGEFGRTPKINARGGRDHWPRVGPCLLAGGRMRTGLVIGETDRYASEPRSRPVHYKDVFATLYRHLGIDARQVTLTDPQGRPQYVLDEGEPIAELV
ncbi:hypothetical protein Mal4_53390 [Maioricimonas rarisocia]|uniref:DUF1501 domain-containing protein n=1 Tax=Maioricimonas rarisocia TaxID=2528026 RepID=A0A517ZEU2_9PLAN|nr:DUF1501 domain-containing protein [Maioricimonas rarisocia]QDU40976.1 hypothetical protein Mal4_53390 [Maioricimonas rarisocia]